MSSFCFVHNNPVAEAQRSYTMSAKNRLSVCLCSTLTTRNNSLGFYLRVIVDETHRNLEETTFSFISVILINLWIPHSVLMRQRFIEYKLGTYVQSLIYNHLSTITYLQSLMYNHLSTITYLQSLMYNHFLLRLKRIPRYLY